MTLGDKTSFIAAGGKLTEPHLKTGDWRWMLANLFQSGVKTVAATNGAVTHDLSYGFTYYTTNSTADIVLTVPDGSIPGERTTIKLHTLDTNNVVVTPTNFHDGSTLTLDATNDSCTLVWDGTNWAVDVNNGGTVA